MTAGGAAGRTVPDVGPAGARARGGGRPGRAGLRPVARSGVGRHQAGPRRRPRDLPAASAAGLGPAHRLRPAAEPGLRLPVPDGAVLLGRAPRVGPAVGGAAGLVVARPGGGVHGHAAADVGAGRRRVGEPGRRCGGLRAGSPGPHDPRRPVRRELAAGAGPLGAAAAGVLPGPGRCPPRGAAVGPAVRRRRCRQRRRHAGGAAAAGAVDRHPGARSRPRPAGPMVGDRRGPRVGLVAAAAAGPGPATRSRSSTTSSPPGSRRRSRRSSACCAGPPTGWPGRPDRAVRPGRPAGGSRPRHRRSSRPPRWRRSGWPAWPDGTCRNAGSCCSRWWPASC